MSEKQCTFVWYDLMARHPQAAASFYGKVIGWESRDAGMGGPPYWLFFAGHAVVGGLMETPERLRAEGVPSMWMGHIGVDDVDAYAEQVRESGGSIHRTPTDIPGVGRFAAVSDPHGATFILFHGKDGQPPVAPRGTPGHIGWRELHAGDMESAFAFYAKLFGWTKVQDLPMGSLGAYRTFAAGGEAIGGMMTRMPGEKSPFWLYYFAVPEIDAAAERVKAAGGTLVTGPTEVPGGEWIVQATDPEGALFALVAPRR